MKKGYWAILLMTFVWTSCTNKSQSDTNDTQGFQIDTVAPNGVQRMQVSNNELDIKLGGKEYHISIHRAPCDSLQRVKDQTGGSFVDNQITLLITRNKGERFFSKTFTKRSFASLIDDKFLSQSILEGMVYDKVSDKGIVFAASVCYPQTDLYLPFSVTISPEGKIAIVKEEVLDENYINEDSIR